ncbi:MAG TPA: lyase family protein, partial [Tepidisphaeraceae bacterium]
MHIAAAVAMQYSLSPALGRLAATLEECVARWDHIVKIGRTHLMDATPIRVGQVFGGYAAQVRNAIDKIDWAIDEVEAFLPIGGTAVGTGINTHPEFGSRVAAELSKRVSREPQPLIFIEATDHPSAQAAKDNFVTAHGYLKTAAIAMTKIANDIRLLGSGPRCGIFELKIPAIQPGSSIMPGKENPVIAESVMQVACRVVGNDATVTMAASGGIGSLFELNVAMPVMIDAFMESVNLLANVSNVFVDKLLIGLEVNEARCRELIDQSLMMITSLAPEIGYDNAAKIAKQAMTEGKTIRQIAREQKLLDDATLERLLDPDAMTRPSADRNLAGGG